MLRLNRIPAPVKEWGQDPLQPIDFHLTRGFVPCSTKEFVVTNRIQHVQHRRFFGFYFQTPGVKRSIGIIANVLVSQDHFPLKSDEFCAKVSVEPGLFVGSNHKIDDGGNSSQETIDKDPSLAALRQ